VRRLSFEMCYEERQRQDWIRHDNELTAAVVEDERMERRGLMNRMPGTGFPSSRDWNMPDVPCERKDCVANHASVCVMPSCIRIGAEGKCAGCKPRKGGT